MAIDTREKRQSVVAISLYPIGPNVTPNAAKDQEWRQQAGYGYSGILAGGAAAAVLISQARSVMRFIQGRVFSRVN